MIADIGNSNFQGCAMTLTVDRPRPLFSELVRAIIGYYPVSDFCDPRSYSPVITHTQTHRHTPRQKHTHMSEYTIDLVAVQSATIMKAVVFLSIAY